MIVSDPELLTEFRRQTVCGACWAYVRTGLDPHHLYSVGAGRVDARWNLIALCRECHSRTHYQASQRKTKEKCNPDLAAYISAREQCLQPDIYDAVEFVRFRVPKHCNEAMAWFLFDQLPEPVRRLAEPVVLAQIRRNAS